MGQKGGPQDGSCVAPLHGHRQPLEEVGEQTLLIRHLPNAVAEVPQECRVSGPQAPEVSMATGVKE